MSRNAPGRMIVFSTGGRNDELATHGIGVEHVQELVVRLAMRLLAHGHRLAFGGTMGIAEQPLTQFLITTAQQWLDSTSDMKVAVIHPETWPLANYSAWPHYTNITEEQRARLVGTCQCLDIDPSGVTKDELKPLAVKPKERPESRRFAADALTAMRNRSTIECDMRVAWGGRIAGSSGWMAGVLEEVAFSLEHNKPTLIFGGFGGCAALLADFLAKKDAAWPEELSLKAASDPERDALLSGADRDRLYERFDRVKRLLTEFRSAIHSRDDGLVNGISSKLIRDGLYNWNARDVIKIAVKAAAGLQQNSANGPSGAIRKKRSRTQRA